MLKKEILQLYKGLNSLGGLRGVKFTYAVAKNLRAIQDEITSLEKSIEADEQFKAYDNARIELAKKHAKKDEKGEAMTENNQFVLEDLKAFEEEHAKVRDEYTEALAVRENQLAEYKLLLDEESSVELHKINLSQVPEDISTEQMYAILPIIED